MNKIKLNFSILDEVKPKEQAKVTEKRRAVTVKLDFSILDRIDAESTHNMEILTADELKEFLEKSA
jgi:hypothetical protein